MTEQRERAKAAQKGGVDDARSTATATSSSSSASPSSSATPTTSPRAACSPCSTAAPTTARRSRSSSTARRSTPSRGGQIGDTGTITTETGAARCSTPRSRSRTSGATRRAIAEGTSCRADRDAPHRRRAPRRDPPQPHRHPPPAPRAAPGARRPRQAGRFVGRPDRLRFDFSHYDAVTPSRSPRSSGSPTPRRSRNIAARAFETTKDEAEALGAIAFFGDKYGDIVRVLEAGSSIELCGGTHVRATGDIGTVKVVSEASIGSNLRRIEAITGEASVALLQRDEQLIAETAGSSAPRRRRARRRAAQARRDQGLHDEIKSLRGQLASAGRPSSPARGRRRVSSPRRRAHPGRPARAGDRRARAAGVRRVVLDRRDDDRRRRAGRRACSPGRASRPRPCCKDAAQAVGGGGGGKGDIATRAARTVGGIDEALRLARGGRRPCVSRAPTGERRPGPRARRRSRVEADRHRRQRPVGHDRHALTTVHRSKSRRHDHHELARIAREEEADVIVVGLPLSLDGASGRRPRLPRRRRISSLAWSGCRWRCTTSVSRP